MAQTFKYTSLSDFQTMIDDLKNATSSDKIIWRKDSFGNGYVTTDVNATVGIEKNDVTYTVKIAYNRVVFSKDFTASTDSTTTTKIASLYSTIETHAVDITEKINIVKLYLENL
jgi:Flp pilus assembly protein TadG